MHLGRLSFFLLAFLTACKLGPDYKRPEVPAPERYKELALWQPAKPAAADPKGDWWDLFEDQGLNDLEKEARQDNQEAKAALARVKEADAIADVNRAAFFPTLSIGGSDNRSQLSANRPLPPPEVGTRYVSNDFNVFGELDYQLDIWGRFGRLFESAEAEAEATKASYENTLLLLQANVAQQYFTIRAYDAEIEALMKAVKYRDDELDLVHKRFLGKIASEIDVSQAETELYSAQSNLLSTRKARAQSEHALAVLLGKPPASFVLAANPLADKAPPVVPPGLPSGLLERRPDIVAAEKAVVARNAEIGAAIGAFFPSISLTAQGGIESGLLKNLFTPGSILWSVLPELTQNIFNGGLNQAELDQSKAAYAESIANYRQQILVGFQQVEDGLSDLYLLSLQYDVQQKTVKASNTTLNLAGLRYQTGVDTYLNVADAEIIALQNELSLIDIQRQRYVASASLIEALGGGWQDKSTKSP